jgi:hypothetical protein
MGIDKMSIAANYHNQAVQATQINKVNVQTSSDTAAKEMVADSKVSTASTVQITNTQKSGCKKCSQTDINQYYNSVIYILVQ